MAGRLERGRRRVVSLVMATVLGVSVLLGVAGRSFAAQAVDEVHYTFTSPTSVAIDWRGDANDVRWGPTSAYGNTAQGVASAWTPWSSPGPFWQLQLDGLTRGATYHYSIGGGPDYTFHTPPTGSFRFDAIGDVGDTVSFSKLGATLSAIANDEPSFVLMVGDLTYANATGASISVVDQHFNDAMNSFATSAAYMPAWGNHEYDVPGSDDLRNYKGRLLMPNAQASPGSPAISCCGDDWGWFDAGPVRFIEYPEPWTGAWADWQTKANVLMSQAQNDPSIKYIITDGHRPAYSTGYHPGEAQLASILDGFGSSYSKYVLNINGHSHDYERFQPIQGVTHITVGAPSSLEQPWSGTDPRTAFRAMHLSHLRVDVSDTGLRIQSVCDLATSKDDMTCAQGSVLDEYTIGTPPSTPPKTQYYVDKTVLCSDTGPGTADMPYCTITKGVARLQAGYILYIGNGTYAESIKPSVSGTAAAPITITAWPGRSPVVTGVTNGVYLSQKSYVTVSNLTVTATVADGIYVTKSDHIVVSGNRVSGSGHPVQGQTAPGISIRTTNSSQVLSNTADHNNGTGIYITSTSTGTLVADNEASFNAEGWQRNANGINVTSPGNTVLRNVTHDNEDSGIQFYTGADNSVAALNVTYNNGDHGIDDLNVTGGRIISNTVYRNCTSGINVEGTSTNYVIENNVAVDNAVYPAYNGIACSRRAGNIGIWDSAPPTTTVDHNLVWLTKSGTLYVFKTPYTSLAAMQAATGQEAAGVQSDPLFFDAPTWNLQLKEGSAAIDRGDSAVSGAQPADVLGNGRIRDPNVDNSKASGPRLYDDLGAYEFQPDVAPAPTPPTARLSVSPTSGTAPLAVTANAGGSTDPQGQALTYAFDFGDGSTSGQQSASTATHTYTTAGTYTVSVRATDTSGLYDTATQVVTVSPAAPTAPTAHVVLTPASGLTPLHVTADASGSTDPQGQALSYAFDFGDGTTTGPQPNASVAHTYTTAGSYTVSVTVTNTSGLSDTATAGVTATAPAAPTAVLNVTPASGLPPMQITADGTASSDPQGQPLSYAFDFGDGMTSGPQAAPTATHVYNTSGTYTVKLTVTDTSGLSNSTTQLVTVAVPASAPTAALTVSPRSGGVPLPVTADASGSSDPQNQTLSYSFDFGDGSPITGPQATATATHTYAAAGTYTVRVTVTNTSGLSDTTTATVTAVAAPTAQLTVTPASGLAPLQVAANAGGSSDPQNQTLSYAFDFGDGVSTGSQAAATANHTYTTTGTYTVAVTVTNTTGLSDTKTATVTVNQPAPPSAALTVTPSSGLTPLQVTADAGGSTDPQGQALTYAFDFGDGATTGTQPTSTATHTYTTAGTYTAKVTVTNTSGLSNTTTATVTVNQPAAPTAALTVTPNSGLTPLQVTADAGGSTDPQGQTLSYAFDFGDGATTGPQAASTATHTYTTAGAYTVKVTVTDTSGLSATKTATVTTTQPVPPTAALTVTPSSGLTPLQVTADAGGSTDPQNQTLSYTFDFGDGATTGPQAASTATHTYTTAGAYTVKVTVTDTSGLSATKTATVTTTQPVPPTAALTVTPSTGLIPLQVTADASGSTDPQGQTLTYAFDFGDGATTGPQAAATATHTYTVAGSYTVKVTVTDASGLTATSTKVVTVATGPTYVGQVGTGSSNKNQTSATITTSRAVKAGDLVVLAVQSTVGTATVTATDDVGNTYASLTTKTDSTGTKQTVLFATATRALALGAHVTVKFSAATASLVAADELTGVTTADRTAGATGATATFSAGPTATLSNAHELVISVVGLTSGKKAPVWATGWTTAGSANTGLNYLARAYLTTTTTAAVTATGTATGTWTALTTTFSP
ncbi:PKD domain-containing protein [Kribbella jejuensis]|uniref:Parallel beta-helix repeat protein n=1 Tax=Kribbella jejuensis TaxID=236068 RepID=A0A542DUA6_9ACTN|nr:PKD domain-containing protein [Kribbella jejuensis]TQJ06660.1 parallel beta-helix repeat protein [Kribbella jejuensis]